MCIQNLKTCVHFIVRNKDSSTLTSFLIVQMFIYLYEYNSKLDVLFRICVYAYKIKIVIIMMMFL